MSRTVGDFRDTEYNLIRFPKLLYCRLLWAPPIWIVKVWHLWPLTVIIVGFRVNVQNFPKIWQYAAEIWPKRTFYNMASVQKKVFEFWASDFITARCTLVQSAVLRSHVVCPSVRPSVTLVNCDHIDWNSSKIISPLVSLGRSLFATPAWRVCSKGNTP